MLGSDNSVGKLTEYSVIYAILGSFGWARFLLTHIPTDVESVDWMRQTLPVRSNLFRKIILYGKS